MSIKRPLPLDPIELRHAAERDLAEQAILPNHTLSKAEALSLLHELQVHQIELEMQNAELKRAEEQIETLLDAYTDLYDYAPVGYLVLDRKGQIQKANLTAAALLGEKRSGLMGQAFARWVAVDSRRAFATFLEGQYAGGAPGACELPLDPREGAAGWIRIEASWPAEVLECRVTFVDVTQQHQAEVERKRYELETLHAQQLDSLGRLAAGVAHDINNILGAIYAVTETLKLKAPAGGGWADSLALIEKATVSGRDLVSGLTRFSRKDPKKPEPVDLHALAQNELSLLERVSPSTLTFTLEAEEPYPFVLAQPGRLGGTLMNLCWNAVDAMPAGGQLTLGIRRLPAAMVELSVTDTGQGMAPEILAQAQEAFFTTKAIGHGTGLGLAMSLATANALGGNLVIESVPGQGTKVALVLPEFAGSVAPVQPDKPVAKPNAPLTILFVDDNALIRASLKPLFEGLGHKVLVASSGLEALQCLADGAACDLVIMDQNMPLLTGLEALKELRRTHPTMPVLIATGNLEASIRRVVSQDRHASCIEKPFSSKEITACIHELMHRQVEGASDG